MKNIRWTIRSDKGIAATGVMQAEDDKDAMSRVLRGEGFTPEPDVDYRIQVGELMTSSPGDEFSLVADCMTGLDDVDAVGADGYLHGAPAGAMDAIGCDHFHGPYGCPKSPNGYHDLPRPDGGKCHECGEDVLVLNGDVVDYPASAPAPGGFPCVTVQGKPVFDVYGNDLSTRCGGVDLQPGDKISVDGEDTEYQVISVDANRAIVEPLPKPKGVKFDLHIDVDMAPMNDAMRECIERIEQLRTKMAQQMGVPREWIHAEAAGPPVHDEIQYELTVRNPNGGIDPTKSLGRLGARELNFPTTSLVGQAIETARRKTEEEFKRQFLYGANYRELELNHLASMPPETRDLMIDDLGLDPDDFDFPDQP